VLGISRLDEELQAFSRRALLIWLAMITVSFVNQSCASYGDSELGRVSSGWVTSPSLSKFGGS